MKRKGFTLIELLAVIVVLAIIALIATPIVMNTIKNAKKGVAERTADNYIKQVETAVAEAKLENKTVPNGTYDIDGNGNLTGAGLPDGKLEINMSGNKPSGGTIKISNGGVSKEGTTMTVGDYDVKYNQEKSKYEATEKGSLNTLCKAVTTATNGNVPQGKFAYGDEYTCELGDSDTKTFYVLETSGDNVSLIMNANVDSNGKAVTSSSTDKGQITWCTEDGSDTSCAASGALNYLNGSTKSWTKLASVNGNVSLPTAQQIATAGGDTTWNVGSGAASETKLSAWLFDNLNNTTNSVANLYGYWTETISTSWGAVWCVDYSGVLYPNGPLLPNARGIRPVITIPKSQLG